MVSLAVAFLFQGVEWLRWLTSDAKVATVDLFDYGLAGDSGIFQAAARILGEAPGLLYDQAALLHALGQISGSPLFGQNSIYLNPPMTAALFTPLSEASLLAGWAAVTAVSVALLLAGLKLLGAPWRWLALTVLFSPAVMSLRLGQLTAASCGILALSLVFQRSGAPFLGGALIGCLIVKPQYAVGVALYWLLDPRQHGRQLAGAIVCSTALLSLTWFHWPDASVAFVESLSRVLPIEDDLGRLVHHFSLVTGVSLLVGPTAAVPTLTAILFLSVPFFRSLRRLPQETGFAFAVAAGLIISPYSVDYDWTLLLVPAAVFWIKYPESRSSLLGIYGLVALAAVLSRTIAVGTAIAFSGRPVIQIAPWALIAAIFLCHRMVDPNLVNRRAT
jgi:hypothetical protein